ncbi:hypothetical protein Q0590_17345 [Rhodocytophaga aerolata]|uniref:Uncharacterized protein n=1 Tax=Rhodocytophaga aerolata TaxID=455078 RepID=A0ABT8R7H6_9BACT|nr:hypothetical protein [Rhodocytophaga aerolata]MDO1448042.1 hypothetical protein [Rhodocytophaga aerolata]
MSFAENILDKLFSNGNAPNEPFVSEILERSKNDKASYQKWMQENKHKELSQIYSLSHFLKKRLITCSANVHIFNSRSANAFSISCCKYIDAKSFQHYFDFLKNRVLEKGYELQHSDREIIDRIHYIETIDRHYLKFPEIMLPTDKINQLYGNIQIEHITIDDRPSYIKLMASYQLDSKFSEPISFDKLTRHLFDF